MLKGFVLKCSNTYDLTLLHLLLDLQATFGRQLFSEEEDHLLLMHLAKLSVQPSLTPSHRLICLDWLHSIALTQEASKASGYLSLVASSESTFFPKVFDGWETMTKKFVLQAALMEVSAVDANSVLWDCLSFVYDMAHLRMNRRAAATVFRCLYALVKGHHLPNLETEAAKLVLKFMASHPKYASHVLDFITSVKNEFQVSELPRHVQRSVVNFIVTTAKSLSPQVLPHYLKILQQIAAEPANVCQPALVVKFLRDVLEMTTVCEQGNWLLGNQLLLVCKGLLQHRTSTHFYRAFGELLFTMMTTFNDIDVQDEARILYMLLTHVSSEKVSNMFNRQLPTTIQLEPLSLITSTTNYSGTKAVVVLNHPVLELSKRRWSFVDTITGHDNIITTFQESEIPKNTLRPYRVFVGSFGFKAVCRVNCELRLVEDQPSTFDSIYCIDIKMSGPDECGPIEIPPIPSLRRSGPACHIIVPLTVSKCLPMRLTGSATFSCEDGTTCECLVTNLNLGFEDFFLPLPVPATFVNIDKEWRERLFDDLWGSFRKSAQLGSDGSTCQESVCLLNLTAAQTEATIRMKLNPFLAGQSKNESGDVVYNVGIFAPPHNHVLMRLEAGEEKVVCRLLVDQWRLLPLLNDFCLSLEDDIPVNQVDEDDADFNKLEEESAKNN